MRRVHYLLIWMMALAVTLAYGEKDNTTYIDDRDLRMEAEPKPVPRRKLPPPPPPVREEEEYEEDFTEYRPPERRFRLDLGFGFGRSLGCIVSCGPFVPIQRLCGGVYREGFANDCYPPDRQVIYKDIYVDEHPSQFQSQSVCPCVGMAGCSCGGQANVLFINQVPPVMNYFPQWQGLQTRMAPVWPYQPKVFKIPTPYQPSNLGPRSHGFIPRLGMDPTAGMN